MKFAVSKSVKIALFLAITLSIASGVVHGWLDGRWVNQPNLKAIGDQLQLLPKQFGDWSLLENQELPESAARQLQCYGYTVQVYKNLKTGSQVTVAVLFGPRGPIAVHTPEVCYSGQGVKPKEARSRRVVKADGETHEFWHVEFLSKNDAKPAMESFYAWSDGGRWHASEYPRIWLTDRLYKIQLEFSPAATGQSFELQPFLEQYLAELQPLLVSTQQRTLSPSE